MRKERVALKPRLEAKTQIPSFKLESILKVKSIQINQTYQNIFL